jgi:CDP-glycerol glycerophosphotransferase
MDFEALMRRCDRWDYLVSPNRFATEVWERSYPSDYETLETGYPRNDRLALADEDETARVRASLGIEPGCTTVLYAPTFRDWGNDGFEIPFDLAGVCEQLGDDHLLLVRAHYFRQTGEDVAELEARGLVRDVSAYPNVEDLLLASDVLLTDYSSVMFDYAVLDRPIVVHAHDWDTYVRCRGVNVDLLATPPGVVTFDEQGLVETLRSGRCRDDEAARTRQAFRKRFCENDDGHASERVVRRVFLGEEAAPVSTHEGS